MRARHGFAALAAVLVSTTPVVAADQPVFEGPVPRADCGPGSNPETPGSLQGEVTVKDRDTGRSKTPYTCNLEQVGNDPDDLKSRVKLAKLLVDSKKLVEAEDIARDATRIDVTDAEAQKVLLEALDGQQKTKEAEELRKRFGTAE